MGMITARLERGLYAACMHGWKEGRPPGTGGEHVRFCHQLWRIQAGGMLLCCALQVLQRRDELGNPKVTLECDCIPGLLVGRGGADEVLWGAVRSRQRSVCSQAPLRGAEERRGC